MFSNESLFRLFSLGLLGILFVSVTALAEKEKKPVNQNLFSNVEHIQEAEQINSDQLQAISLTTIGERTEVVTVNKVNKTDKTQN